MNRRGFLKRMAFAALACGFLQDAKLRTLAEWSGALSGGEWEPGTQVAIVGSTGALNSIVEIQAISYHPDGVPATLTVRHLPDALDDNDYIIHANAVQ